MKQGLVVLFAALVLYGAGCSDKADQYLQDIQSDNDAVRQRAMTQLVLMKRNPETIRKLIDMLETADDRTTLMIVQLLSTADSTAIDALGETSKHPVAAIRDYSVYSLGMIGGAEAAPYVVAALQDSVPAVRYSATYALGLVGDSASVKYLFPMLRDEVDSIRKITVHSMYMNRREEGADIHAADFAIPANDQSDVVRYVTAQALGEAYPDSTIAGELLIELLSDQNKSVREEAIKSLGRIKYEPAVRALKQMYDFATIEEMLEISEAVKQISGEDFPPPDEEG